ncbi:MAG: hypothetical protein KJN95_03160 [Gammaproteobacteria bacterium]|nr:hypothetical protein [Gammaproteobacteria bacterium]MBT8435950.1 hypothetical protein [Gammaproteobacteria bacterium]
MIRTGGEYRESIGARREVYMIVKVAPEAATNLSEHARIVVTRSAAAGN